MAEVVCIGGACIDRKYQILSDAQLRTSNPARARRTFGGVARNVAENLARLGVDVRFVTKNQRYAIWSSTGTRSTR